MNATTALTAHLTTQTTDRYCLDIKLLNEGLDEATCARVRESHCDFFASFDTEADRDAFIALFPKMVNFRKSYRSTSARDFPAVRLFISMSSTGTTGAANETGMKRWTRFAAIATQLFPAR